MHVPGASFGDLQWSIRKLLDQLPDNVKIFGSHGSHKGSLRVPQFDIGDFIDYHLLLEGIQDDKRAKLVWSEGGALKDYSLGNITLRTVTFAPLVWDRTNPLWDMNGL